MPNIGMPELIMIFVIALVVFGPKQLPEIGRMIGKASQVLRKANQDLRNSMKMDMNFDDPYPKPQPRKIIPSPIEPREEEVSIIQPEEEEKKTTND